MVFFKYCAAIILWICCASVIAVFIVFLTIYPGYSPSKKTILERGFGSRWEYYWKQALYPSLTLVILWFWAELKCGLRKNFYTAQQIAEQYSWIRKLTYGVNDPKYK